MKIDRGLLYHCCRESANRHINATETLYRSYIEAILNQKNQVWLKHLVPITEMHPQNAGV